MTRNKTRHSKGYPFLFSPFPLGPHTLKNRLVALPVHTGFALPDGRVSEWMVDFYARLAPGAAMVVVANAAVSPDGMVSRFNLRADRDKFIPGLTRLAAAIKSNGSVSCLQLNHAGRFAKTQRPLLPSPIIADNLAFNVESLREFMKFFPFERRFSLTRQLFSQITTWADPMTQEERERVIQDFGTAAARARQAGFDLVELHGANGYLLCQYLSKFTNKLETGFGGDPASRAAFPLAVIRAIKKKVPEFPIGLRIILQEWVPGGIDLGQAIAFARSLEKESPAYVSASAATYNSLFTPEVRQKMAGPAYLEKETTALTEAVGIPTIISGRITTPACADRLVRKGAADLIGLGRPLRADPNWVTKALTPDKKIIPCLNCNQCLKQVVLEKGFCCRQWPGWKQMQTRLEHKMLTRSTRALWVVAHPLDIEIFKSYFPLLLPGGKKNPEDSVLFLCDPGQAPEFYRLKKNLLDWLSNRINLAEMSGISNTYCLFAPLGNWENTVLNEIHRQNHGRVFLAARPDQPWRSRLLYRTRRKMTALLNSTPFPCRALVLVDLSETTLLVLRALGRTLMKKPLFSFDFIHVQTDPVGTGQVHTWKQARQIAGISHPIPLERINAQTDVVSALVPLIQSRGYGTIVMGKRGISGIKRWVLGSVSAGLLKHLTTQSLFLID